MRIVIETDPPDESKAATIQTSDSERVATILDGGPAPAALLRQFGRIPERAAEWDGDEESERYNKGESYGQGNNDGEDQADESEASEKLNPLRQGAVIAAHRHTSGGPAPAREELPEASEDMPAEDPEAR